jgi:hypothetical protein
LSDSETQLGVVKDVLLPVDAHCRYDVYFTDRRVAIVCMGKASHFESDSSGPISFVPSAFGVPPTTSSYIEKTVDKQAIDREVEGWSLDSLLKLSKKSCFYTLEEIEEVKLVAGDKPKFVILSEDCESKFAVTEQQFVKLSQILPKIEPLRSKLWVSGKWDQIEDVMTRNR